MIRAIAENLIDELALVLTALVDGLIFTLATVVFIPVWCWDAARNVVREAWWQLTQGRD